MPVRGVILPIGRLRWELDHPLEPYPWLSILECFAWDSFKKDVESGRTESSLICNGRRLSEAEMRRIVALDQRYQMLELRGNPSAYYGIPAKRLPEPSNIVPR
jgi:hypothetical protein